jgi:hypothetical protein
MSVTKIPISSWTDEQKKAFRSQGVGGSEIAAVPGISLSKYKSGIELFLEKIGEPVFEFKGNRFTEFGKLHEVEIADKLFPYYEMGTTADDLFKNRREGKVIEKVQKYPYKLVNTKFPWLFAEIDRRITTIKGKPGVLECKNTTTMASNDFEEGIDPSHLCQLQHYVFVTNWTYGKLAYQLDGNDFRCFEFGVIKEIAEAIEYFSATFWQKVEKAREIKKEFKIDSYYGVNPMFLNPEQSDGVAILQSLEPDLNGLKCEVEFLRKYIKPTPEYSEMPGTIELLDMAKNYHTACEKEKEAKEEKSKWQNEIVVGLGGVHVAKYDKNHISYKPDSRGSNRLHISPKLLTT